MAAQVTSGDFENSHSHKQDAGFSKPVKVVVTIFLLAAIITGIVILAVYTDRDVNDTDAPLGLELVTKHFIVIAFLLAANLLFLALLTTLVRAYVHYASAPEDSSLPGLGASKHNSLHDPQNSTVARIQAAHRNAVENILAYGLVSVAFLYSQGLPGSDGGAQNLGVVCAWLFLGSRWFHTFFYLFGIQPFRTLCFLVGFGAIGTLGISACSEVYNN
jgi:uncharacterized MAPEG superfamily protein